MCQNNWIQRRALRSGDYAMTDKHTPTPWKTHRSNATAICSVKSDRDGDDIVIGFLNTKGRVNFPSTYSFPKHSVQEANAKRIVKCVNMHDELVRLLTESVEWVDYDPNGKFGNDVQKALAKARGES